jgi:DNA-binding NtrC family response regulator
VRIMATASRLPVGSAVVLLVESHNDSREMYACYLQLCGFTVQTADTTDDGLIHASEADVIVTGMWVPGSFDGVELVGGCGTPTRRNRRPSLC